MIEWIITTAKTWPGMLVLIVVGMAVMTAVMMGADALRYFIADFGSFVTAPGGLKPRRMTKQDRKETAERLAKDRQQNYWDFMAEFLENNAEKHQLSTADVANIKKYEQGLGRAWTAPACFMLLGIFFIVRLGIMTGYEHGLSFGVFVMAATAIAVAVALRAAGKRVYAAQCGWCDAYVLEVTEKLWRYELADSDTGGGGFCFYVRCSGVVLEVPAKVCRGIGRHVLVVRYLYNRQKEIALEQRGLKPTAKLYYYPGTM
jgi:hypothetical protein